MEMGKFLSWRPLLLSLGSPSFPLNLIPSPSPPLVPRFWCSWPTRPPAPRVYSCPSPPVPALLWPRHLLPGPWQASLEKDPGTRNLIPMAKSLSFPEVLDEDQIPRNTDSHNMGKVLSTQSCTCSISLRFDFINYYSFLSFVPRKIEKHSMRFQKSVKSRDSGSHESNLRMMWS